VQSAEGFLLDATTFSSSDDRWQLIDDAYLELLPDLRVNVSDPAGPASFWSRPEGAPQVHFAIDFDRPGRYDIFVRSRNLGPLEESGWVGIDGFWTGGTFQTCSHRGEWNWSDCPQGQAPSVDVASSGVHTLMIAGRDDGFEFDRLFLRGPLDRDEVGAPAAAGPVIVGGAVHPWLAAGVILMTFLRRHRSARRNARASKADGSSTAD